MGRSAGLNPFFLPSSLPPQKQNNAHGAISGRRAPISFRVSLQRCQSTAGPPPFVVAAMVVGREHFSSPNCSSSFVPGQPGFHFAWRGRPFFLGWGSVTPPPARPGRCAAAPPLPLGSNGALDWSCLAGPECTHCLSTLPCVPKVVELRSRFFHFCRSPPPPRAACCACGELLTMMHAYSAVVPSRSMASGPAPGRAFPLQEAPCVVIHLAWQPVVTCSCNTLLLLTACRLRHPVGPISA